MATYSHNANDVTTQLLAADATKCTQSGEYNSTYAGWKAFNHDGDASFWSNTAGEKTGWLKWDLGAGRKASLTSYTVTSRGDGYLASCPVSMHLSGSNDDSSWDELDSQHGLSWGIAEMKTFTFGSATAGYRYWKIDAVASGLAVAIGEVELIGDLIQDTEPSNYLCSRDRDRMRTKGISLGARTSSDRNTSFLIARHNRLRVDGVSLENVYSSYTGILSLLLSVPAVPTVTSSTSKIEETPIAIEADDLDTLEVPAVPTVTPGATVYTYTDDGECTISIASPAEITLAGHGLAANHEVYFKTSGALPTGIVQYTHYYVKSPAEDTFNISAAAGGAAINTSGSQSGTHKLWTKD